MILELTAITPALEEVVHEVSNTPEFIGTLGLNLKLFIAQLINFSVILFVLWKWAYTPLVKLMDARTAKIEKGLEDAKRIEEELRATNAKRTEVLMEAKKEAKEVLENAHAAAAKQKEEMVVTAKRETEKIVKQAKATIAQEKDEMLREVKAHAAELVIAVTEKVIAEKLTQKKDKELVEAMTQSIR